MKANRTAIQSLMEQALDELGIDDKSIKRYGGVTVELKYENGKIVLCASERVTRKTTAE